MIEKLSPAVRKLLITSRCKAMGGDMPSALSELDSTVSNLPASAAPLDRVALLMLKAELLYLDCRYEEALDVFVAIEPLLSLLQHEERIVVEDNRNCLLLQGHQTEATSSFYRLHDERELASLRIWDESSMMMAQDAAAEGKHYEALPGYWRQLVCSYKDGYWRTFVWTSKAMGRECLCLGWMDEAAHHASVAEDGELLTSIGKALVAKRDSELIQRTVKKLLSNANLKRHATGACKLFAEIGDVVPEDQIQPTVQWLLQRASINPNSWSEIHTLNAAWDAVKSVAPQLNAEQARQVVNIATSHPMWKTAHTCREHLIEAVHFCLAALPDDDLRQLARNAIPLVTELKFDADYVSAINLLCSIASRADEDLKTTLADALYPAGTEVASSILLQIAPVFGKQIASTEQISAWAREVTRRLSLQVQRLKPDQEAARVSGSMGQVTSTKNGVQVVVNMVDHHDLAALAKHRHEIPTDSLTGVIQSILMMATDEDNSFSDRALLIHILEEFADVIPEEMSEEVLANLSAVADGIVAVSPTLQDEFDPDNPLNPFKIRMGGASQVQGTALKTLAAIDKAKSGVYGERLNPILERALTSEDKTVRLWAFRAAGLLPDLSQSVLTAVLFGMRDPDPIAAGWALGAVIDKASLQLEKAHMHALIYSLTMAVQSVDVNLRRAAAIVIARLRDSVNDEDLGRNVAHLEDILARDVSHSVRISLGSVASERESRSDAEASQT